MCGRYVLAADPTDLVALFDVDETGTLPDPSYNIAPTDPVAVVVEPPARDDGVPVRRLEAARWGLLPPWARDRSGAAKAINARSEGLAERRMFAPSLERRRAVIPADGWYEWQKPARTPYFVHADAPFAFAGLYAWWKDEQGAWLLTTTILTAEATGDLATLHERMPVVLPPELVDAWLDPATVGDQDLVDEVVARAGELVPSLVRHEVGAAVGNVRNQGPALIAPVA